MINSFITIDNFIMKYIIRIYQLIFISHKNDQREDLKQPRANKCELL